MQNDVNNDFENDLYFFIHFCWFFVYLNDRANAIERYEGCMLCAV